MKLERHVVAKPWGRRGLAPPFGDSGDAAIGEIWFAAPATSALLVKYLFTSERLSIQVHPDDTQARARGLAGGKTECWYIVDADAGATIGVGLSAPIAPEALRVAAESGAIAGLLDWRPVARGDFLHVPAGTIHAIGAGIMLVEVQQNTDVTYRLFDYGRPRELHLDAGIAVARTAPYPAQLHQSALGPGNAVLVEDAAFTVRRIDHVDAGVTALADRARWVVPLAGEARSGEDVAVPGDCLFLSPGAPLALEAATVLLVTA